MSSDRAQQAPTIVGLAAEAAGPLMSFGIISMVANLLMLVGSLFMLQVYDRVLPSRSLPTLVALLLLVVLLYVVYAAIETLRSRMSDGVAPCVASASLNNR